MPSKIGWSIRTIEIFIIVAFLLFGGVCLFEAFQLESGSLPSESPRIFFQSLYNGNSYMGVIEASLSPNSSFVVGANITAQIKIVLLGASNNTYLIEIMFLDALVVRDIPPYAWQQDWTYLLHDTQINGTEQIQTLSNVTLIYAQEGIYGLNMTITQTSTNTKLNSHFDNLIQIKPLSYLEEQFRSNVTFALTYGIFGLSFIMVATAVAQLIDFFEKMLEKPKTEILNMQNNKGRTRGSRMSENTKKYDTSIVFVTLVFLILMIILWLFFSPSIDYSGTIPNAAGQPTRIAAQTVPTLVNGITTVTGITIAFGGAIIGISFREVIKDKPKARNVYIGSLALFLFPLGYLWGSYLLLAVGLLDFAIKYALTGLILALFAFVGIYLFTAKRLNIA